MRSSSVPFAVLALAACHSDSDSDPTPGVQGVVNHGLAVQRVYGSGELRLVAVSERDQGGDLDGDGDIEDVVLHVFDQTTRNLTNTGLALVVPLNLGDVVPPPSMGATDSLAVFPVSESATGADVDGDGTIEDFAHWTFERRTGRLAPLPFVASAWFLDDDLAAFFAAEGVHVLDAREGSSPVVLADASSLVGVGDRVVAFTRAEAGAVDLNADGDVVDLQVLHLYDADTGRLENTAFDVAVLERPLPVRVAFRSGFAGFSALEALNGGLDLNGDGDAEDRVFVAVSGYHGTVRIPGFDTAFEAGTGSPESARFLLAAFESGTDRNGDGDGIDEIGVVYDPVSDEVDETGLALAIPVLLKVHTSIALTADEIGQDADLDGDGELSSHVPHVFDWATDELVNLGFHGQFLTRLDGQFLGVRFERVGGSIVSAELFAWDLATRSTRLLGVEVADLRAMDGDTALLQVPETASDRNADGDQDDLVLALYDGSTGDVRNLGLAGFFTVPVASRESGLVLVPEGAQGRRDLNGDGDADDVVLHEIVLGR